MAEILSLAPLSNGLWGFDASRLRTSEEPRYLDERIQKGVWSTEYYDPRLYHDDYVQNVTTGQFRPVPVPDAVRPLSAMAVDAPKTTYASVRPPADDARDAFVTTNRHALVGECPRVAQLFVNENRILEKLKVCSTLPQHDPSFATTLALNMDPIENKTLSTAIQYGLSFPKPSRHAMHYDARLLDFRTIMHKRQLRLLARIRDAQEADWHTQWDAFVATLDVDVQESTRSRDVQVLAMTPGTRPRREDEDKSSGDREDPDMDVREDDETKEEEAKRGEPLSALPSQGVHYWHREALDGLMALVPCSYASDRYFFETRQVTKSLPFTRFYTRCRMPPVISNVLQTYLYMQRHGRDTRHLVAWVQQQCLRDHRTAQELWTTHPIDATAKKYIQTDTATSVSLATFRQKLQPLLEAIPKELSKLLGMYPWHVRNWGLKWSLPLDAHSVATQPSAAAVAAGRIVGDEEGEWIIPDHIQHTTEETIKGFIQFIHKPYQLSDVNTGTGTKLTPVQRYYRAMTPNEPTEAVFATWAAGRTHLHHTQDAKGKETASYFDETTRERSMMVDIQSELYTYLYRDAGGEKHFPNLPANTGVRGLIRFSVMLHYLYDFRQQPYDTRVNWHKNGEGRWNVWFPLFMTRAWEYKRYERVNGKLWLQLEAKWARDTGTTKRQHLVELMLDQWSEGEKNRDFAVKFNRTDITLQGLVARSIADRMVTRIWASRPIRAIQRQEAKRQLVEQGINARGNDDAKEEAKGGGGGGGGDDEGGEGEGDAEAGLTEDEIKEYEEEDEKEANDEKQEERGADANERKVSADVKLELQNIVHQQVYALTFQRFVCQHRIQDYAHELDMTPHDCLALAWVLQRMLLQEGPSASVRPEWVTKMEQARMHWEAGAGLARDKDNRIDVAYIEIVAMMMDEVALYRATRPRSIMAMYMIRTLEDVQLMDTDLFHTSLAYGSTPVVDQYMVAPLQLLSIPFRAPWTTEAVTEQKQRRLPSEELVESNLNGNNRLALLHAHGFAVDACMSHLLGGAVSRLEVGASLEDMLRRRFAPVTRSGWLSASSEENEVRAYNAYERSYNRLRSELSNKRFHAVKGTGGTLNRVPGMRVEQYLTYFASTVCVTGAHHVWIQSPLLRVTIPPDIGFQTLITMDSPQQNHALLQKTFGDLTSQLLLLARDAHNQAQRTTAANDPTVDKIRYSHREEQRALSIAAYNRLGMYPLPLFPARPPLVPTGVVPPAQHYHTAEYVAFIAHHVCMFALEYLLSEGIDTARDQRRRGDGGDPIVADKSIQERDYRRFHKARFPLSWTEQRQRRRQRQQARQRRGRSDAAASDAVAAGGGEAVRGAAVEEDAKSVVRGGGSGAAEREVKRPVPPLVHMGDWNDLRGDPLEEPALAPDTNPVVVAAAAAVPAQDVGGGGGGRGKKGRKRKGQPTGARRGRGRGRGRGGEGRGRARPIQEPSDPFGGDSEWEISFDAADDNTNLNASPPSRPFEEDELNILEGTGSRLDRPLFSTDQSTPLNPAEPFRRRRDAPLKRIRKHAIESLLLKPRDVWYKKIWLPLLNEWPALQEVTWGRFTFIALVYQIALQHLERPPHRPTPYETYYYQRCLRMWLGIDAHSINALMRSEYKYRVGPIGADLHIEPMVNIVHPQLFDWSGLRSQKGAYLVCLYANLIHRNLAASDRLPPERVWVQRMDHMARLSQRSNTEAWYSPGWCPIPNAYARPASYMSLAIRGERENACDLFHLEEAKRGAMHAGRQLIDLEVQMPDPLNLERNDSRSSAAEEEAAAAATEEAFRAVTISAADLDAYERKMQAAARSPLRPPLVARPPPVDVFDQELPSLDELFSGLDVEQRDEEKYPHAGGGGTEEEMKVDELTYSLDTDFTFWDTPESIDAIRL